MFSGEHPHHDVFPMTARSGESTVKIKPAGRSYTRITISTTLNALVVRTQSETKTPNPRERTVGAVSVGSDLLDMWSSGVLESSLRDYVSA